MIEVMKFNDFNISIFKSHKPKNCSPPPKPSPLPYTIDQNPLIQSDGTQLINRDMSVRNYVVFGQTSKRMTQHSNLFQKLREITGTTTTTTNLPLVESEESGIKSDIEWKEVICLVLLNQLYQPEQSRTQRYFHDINSFSTMSKGVCRRCKIAGHFEKLCTNDPSDEPEQMCKFCLGDHFHLRCPNTLCYKCNKSGHMAKDCGQSVSFMRCHNCGKKGHVAKSCGILVEQFRLEDEDCSTFKVIRCMVCHHRGHLNCDISTSKKLSDGLYSDWPTVKKVKSEKQKYITYDYVDDYVVDDYVNKVKIQKKIRDKQSKKVQKLLRQEEEEQELLEQGVFQKIRNTKKKQKSQQINPNWENRESKNRESKNISKHKREVEVNKFFKIDKPKNTKTKSKQY